MWLWVLTGPKTENGYAIEDQKQFIAPSWACIKWTEYAVRQFYKTSVDYIDTARRKVEAKAYKILLESAPHSEANIRTPTLH
jgi:hypothetical protein